MGAAASASILNSVRLPGLTALCAALLLAGCSGSEPVPSPEQETQAAAQVPAGILAPSGRYELDPTHASLQFRVRHFGLSNYVMRFTDFDVSLVLDVENLAASSVTVSVDPTSVKTDYPDTYLATHGSRGFQSWDEELAQAPRFLNAAQYPEITFQSTQVEPVAPDRWRVTGDLTMVGHTNPVTLDVSLIGSAEAFRAAGNRGALGLSATGTFLRSAFGMTSPTQLVAGDEVTVQFDGELHQLAEDGDERATGENEPAA